MSVRGFIRKSDWWAFVAALILVGATSFLAWSGLDSVIPGGILTQARRNSEGLIFAALMITLVPSKNRGSRWPGLVWISVVGVGFLITELGASALDLPGWITTLNEAVIGAIVVAGYFFGSTRRRRPSLWFYVALILIILAGEIPIAGWESSAQAAWIVSKAESWGFALLAGLYFDFVNPLPHRKQRLPLWIWVLGLVAVPLTFSALNSNGVDSVAAVGPVESLLVWVQRITEAFVAMIIVTVYHLMRSRFGQSGDD